MNPALLSVRGLSVRFPGAKGTMAVKDVSFDLAAGELVAIVGESGSGKSITALSLMQLLPNQAEMTGSLLFSPATRPTVDLAAISGKQVNAVRGKDIAMVFQEPMTSLNPVFTCGFQVMESIRLHQKLSRREAKKKAVALFEQVQLPRPEEILHRYPHQLSGGQKQRVMIAMAISCNPALLVADEPTTALDVTVQKTILDLVRSLQQQMGMSILLITHDLGLVSDIADRVLVMYKGTIVEQGPTSQVLHSPAHPYTRALMACRPGLHARGKRLPVVSDYLDTNAPAQVSVRVAGETPAKESSAGSESDTVHAPSSMITRATSPVILQLKNVKVIFPGKRLWGRTIPAHAAVDGVSFDVRKGETLGLVGESGCGKTTLGRAILQLLPVSGGHILLNDVDLASMRKSALQPMRKDLQIVFQDPYGSLNPRLTIGDALSEPMKVHGVERGKAARKERVIDLLEKVDLRPEHFNYYPHQFSGGQRQRICIARALVLNPSFLVFDESVSALDVSVQAQVLNLLNDLKKEFGFTAIFISHDLSVVRFVSDRILVMQAGKIVEEGDADEVYFSPQHPYTKQLIAAIPGKTLVA